MEVLELLNSGVNVSITVSSNDLREFANTIVENARRDLETALTDMRAETYPSPDKVAEILDVDRVTLWRWNKSGYLKTIEIGGKRRYKMSDVQRILNGGE